MKTLGKFSELIFNTASYGIVVTDQQHLLLTANAHFCEITGYDKEVLEGRSLLDLLSPKTRPKVSSMYQDIAEGITHPERIIKVFSKNGRPFVLSLSIQYLQEGEDHFFISSFKTIDTSNRYLNLFKETEKAAKIGGWEIDLISMQPLGTDAMKDIYDLPHDTQFTIEKSLRFFLPECRSRLEQALENARKKGQPFNLELQIISAQGKHKWVKVTCNPYMVKGQTVRLYGTIQDITEKHKDKQLLEKQHDFLRQLIDTTPNQILVKDREGKLVLVNKAFADFYGTTPEQLTGNTNQKLGFHDEETIEKFDTEDRLIFEGKQNRIVQEEKVCAPNGTAYWFKSVKTPVISERGAIDQLLMVAVDITEQKQTALEIARSEAYLKAIFNSGEIGIFAIDKNLRAIFFNDYHARRHHEIHGWELKEGELIITNPALIEEYAPLFNRALEGECFIVENKVPNLDGTFHWGEFSFSPIKIQGEIMGTLVMVRDITNRKKAEQKVKDSERRFRAIIENGFDCIVLYNEAGEMTYVSATVLKTFGYKEEELLGRKGVEFIHPDDLEERYQHIKNVVKGKEKNVLRQERVRHKDGHYLWIEVSITNMFDEPSVGAIVASFREITDRKLAEQTQKQALQREKSLNESLKKTNTELDQFVYSTSHNLRAPLTSIMGVVHILKSEKELGAHVEMVELIEKSVHQLDATIQEITDYARNNRIEILLEPVNFKKIITDIIDSLKFLEGANKIRIRCEVKECHNFYSDARRLKVIFNNLLSNAIKYQNLKIERPEINILVTQKGNKAIIKVQDNGIGIRADQQDKIFDMFHRATDRSNGAGLGLYIVKETLDKLNGTIHIETTYGEGTAFTLEIPNLYKKKSAGKLSLH